MDCKLISGTKEIPASHVDYYADSNGFLSLLKMHTLGRSLALNSQRHFDLSTYVEVLAGKLKSFAYLEGKVRGNG